MKMDARRSWMKDVSLVESQPGHVFWCGKLSRARLPNTRRLVLSSLSEHPRHLSRCLSLSFFFRLQLNMFLSSPLINSASHSIGETALQLQCLNGREIFEAPKINHHGLIKYVSLYLSH